MESHRAVIIGAGRIAAGFQWPEHSFVYTHVATYAALAHRVALAAFVETNEERAKWAEKTYGVHVYTKIEEAINLEEADIVSVCVQPKDQAAVMAALPASVKGVWVEKPCMYFDSTRPTQVNFIRRFERVHQKVKVLLDSQKLGKAVTMIVQAKADEHTICHFADLSLFWGIPIQNVQYTDTRGLNFIVTNYSVMCENGVISFSEGGAHYTIYGTRESKIFPGIKVGGGMIAQGDWTPTFMEAALKNLLDVVDDETGEKKLLLSPPNLEVNERSETIAKRFS
jgi:hypothetical protein